MSGLTIAGTVTPFPGADTTLWLCKRCNALISIQSHYSGAEAYCPACFQMPLEFCGTFNGISAIRIGNA